MIGINTDGQGIPLFDYETIPNHPQVGSFSPSNNVGGSSGGTLFLLHERDASIRVLDVFRNGNTIVALRVTFTSGNTVTTGTPPRGSPAGTITFEPGEKIVGDIILTGNGSGSGLGFMKFKTSKDKTFAVGGDNPNGGSVSTEFPFPSGGSYLMGFWGRSDSVIDTLGLYMMKPLQKESIINTVYTILPNPNKNPNRLSEAIFNNGSPLPSERVLMYKKITSSTKEWSVKNSFVSTVGIEVSGSIPVIDVDVTVSAEIMMSTESTATSTTFMATEDSETRTVTDPGCARGTHTVTDFEYRTPIEYRGELQFTFTDSTSYRLAVSGTYRSVYTTATNLTTIGEPIFGGLCPSEGAAPTGNPPTTPTATSPSTPTATPPIAPTVVPPTAPTATSPIAPTATPPTTPTATPPITPTAIPPSTPGNPGGTGGTGGGVSSLVNVENIENAQFIFGSTNLVPFPDSPNMGSMGKGGMRQLRREFSH